MITRCAACQLPLEWLTYHDRALCSRCASCRAGTNRCLCDVRTLDNVDVSNRAMMDAMEELLRIDIQMCKVYGDKIPTTSAYNSLSTPARPSIASPSAISVSLGGIVVNGGSMVGRDLSSMVRSTHGENARIISDVVQPVSLASAPSNG